MANQTTLEIDTYREPDQVVVVLRGELDLGSVEHLEQALSARDGNDGALVIDLTELQFIDSSGMRVLLGIHAQCLETGRELLVRPGPPAVQRVFELTHIDKRLPFASRG